MQAVRAARLPCIHPYPDEDSLLGPHVASCGRPSLVEIENLAILMPTGRESGMHPEATANEDPMAVNSSIAVLLSLDSISAQLRSVSSMSIGLPVA